MSTQAPKPSPSKKSTKSTKKTSKNDLPDTNTPNKNSLEDNLGNLFDRFSDATSSAFKFAKKNRGHFL